MHQTILSNNFNLTNPRLFLGDCVDALERISSNSVDLIFADPPYNLQLGGDLYRPDNSKVDAVDDAWDKFASFEDYDQFTERWLKACRRVLKPNGSIWLMGSYHNIFRVGKIVQDLGYWIQNDVIWAKSNPMPNFRGQRFTNAHETLIWAGKTSKSKPTFHYEAMKAYNDDLQMRSVWELPICSGSERLKKNGEKLHPTQKPEELLMRVLLATSDPGDVVLDPFMGTGTTGAVARRLGRNFIGIERDRAYIDAARERIEATVPLTDALVRSFAKRKEARVPFGSLVANGTISPGAILTDAKRRFEAVVKADGTLECGGTVASIHRMACHLTGEPSCNGWEFWHVLVGGDLVQIDDFRMRQRALAKAA